MKKILATIALATITALTLAGCNEKTFDDIPYQSSTVTQSALYQLYDGGTITNSNLIAMDVSLDEKTTLVGVEDNTKTIYSESTSSNQKFKTDLSRPTLVIDTDEDNYIYRNDKVLINKETIEPAASTASLIASTKSLFNIDRTYTLSSIEEKTFKGVNYYKGIVSSSFLNSNSLAKTTVLTSRMGERHDSAWLYNLLDNALESDMYIYFGDGMCMVSFSPDDLFPYNADHYIVCDQATMESIIDRVESYNLRGYTKKVYYAARYDGKIKTIRNLSTNQIAEKSEIVYFCNTVQDAGSYRNIIAKDNILNIIKQEYNTYIGNYTFEIGINSTNIITMLRVNVLYYRPVQDNLNSSSNSEAFYSYTKTCTLNDYTNDIKLVDNTDIYNKFN